jgi:hypothetical protein
MATDMSSGLEFVAQVVPALSAGRPEAFLDARAPRPQRFVGRLISAAKRQRCHHEPAPAAHASFNPDVPAGRARDLLLAGTSQTQRIAGFCHSEERSDEESLFVENR